MCVCVCVYIYIYIYIYAYIHTYVAYTSQCNFFFGFVIQGLHMYVSLTRDAQKRCRSFQQRQANGWAGRPGMLVPPTIRVSDGDGEVAIPLCPQTMSGLYYWHYHDSM